MPQQVSRRAAIILMVVVLGGLAISIIIGLLTQKRETPEARAQRAWRDYVDETRKQIQKRKDPNRF